MKKLLLFTLFVLTCSIAWAQRPAYGGGQRGPSITGKIVGTLADSITGTPVEFATVVLLEAGTDKQKTGVTTDENGDFKLENVAPGKYDIQISFLGYETKTIRGIETTPKKPDYNLENLSLSSEGIELEGVEVTGEKSVFEAKIDKLVYNAEKDVTTRGGDASDVLSNVPLLSVDSEGNVSLRGNSNLQILINGQPSIIFSGNVGDALKTIPADQIKSVEVITVPTARYDGEGTGGIINIITKKSRIDGFTGSVNASVGLRANRGSLNLNYARGRFGMNFNGSGWATWPRETSSSFYREDYRDDQTRILEQESEGDGNFYGPRFSVGAFYDINAYNSLNTSLTYRGFGRNDDSESTSRLTNPTGIEEYTRTSEDESLRGGFDWTTDYRHTFKKPQQEFVFAVRVSGDQSTNDNSVFQSGTSADQFLDQRSTNDGMNLETTLQADYIHPFSKKVKLETGLKSIFRTIESDFRFEDFNLETQQYELTRSRSDDFTYNQDVYAAYASFNAQLGEKWGVVVGARYELTDIEGDYEFRENPFANDYNSFLPSAIVSYKFSQASTLRASYSSRIQRPSLYYINPYFQNSDPFDVTVGNPELLPENTDQYELNFNTFVKGVVLNASVFYRETADVIEGILDVQDNGRSITTYQNIGENEQIGANFFTQATLFKIVKLRAGVNGYNYKSTGIINGERLSNDAWVWGGNAGMTVNLPKSFTFEVNGFYRSPRQSIQGSRASYRRISFGLNKELMNDRASLGLVISQPFSRDLDFVNELEGPTFYQRSVRSFASRNLALSFNYRFGKLDFKQQRRRGSRIDNSDLKGGEGGEY